VAIAVAGAVLLVTPLLLPTTSEFESIEAEPAALAAA
jgi:hypothetical protein